MNLEQSFLNKTSSIDSFHATYQNPLEDLAFLSSNIELVNFSIFNLEDINMTMLFIYSL